MPDTTERTDESQSSRELVSIFQDGPDDGGAESNDEKASTNRGGRPAKPKRKRKSERVSIYFSPEQLAEIETKAEAADRSVSGFIRRAALGQKLTPQADDETRRQLQRAGVNLNQLAKVAHSTGEIEASRQLEDVLDVLRNAARKID